MSPESRNDLLNESVWVFSNDFLAFQFFLVDDGAFAVTIATKPTTKGKGAFSACLN